MIIDTNRKERKPRKPRDPNRKKRTSKKKKRYLTYIDGPIWRAKRKVIFDEIGYKCEICSSAGPRLEVHHLHYERIGGSEKIRDLQVLCKACHNQEHKCRKKHTFDSALAFYAYLKTLTLEQVQKRFSRQFNQCFINAVLENNKKACMKS